MRKIADKLHVNCDKNTLTKCDSNNKFVSFELQMSYPMKNSTLRSELCAAEAVKKRRIFFGSRSELKDWRWNCTSENRMFTSSLVSIVDRESYETLLLLSLRMCLTRLWILFETLKKNLWWRMANDKILLKKFSSVVREATNNDKKLILCVFLVCLIKFIRIYIYGELVANK